MFVSYLWICIVFMAISKFTIGLDYFDVVSVDGQRSSFSFRGSENATSCGYYTSCNSCMNSKDLHCSWCAADSKCTGESGSCSRDQLQGCDQTYYTIIFIVVISGVICLCCGTCYLRRQSQQRGETIASLLSPLLPATARNYLFRNSLMGEGELEWMCIICGFDNKPRSVHCTMCGTEHQFSQDYKFQKIEEKKQMKIKYQEHRAAKLEKEQKKKEKVDILIPEEAQITSISMSLKYGSTANAAQSVSMSGPAATPQKSLLITRDFLSPDRRKEAINYRRLNQLSLRQKSARRRKMWQRRVDPVSGLLVWVRVPINEIKVKNTPFGYTPRPSLDGRAVSDENSYNITQSLLHGTSFSGMSNTSNNSNTNDHIRDLMYAAEHTLNSPQTSVHGRKGVKPRAVSKASSDSFGDSALVSYSPGYTSVFDEEGGGLVWKKVDSDKNKTAKKSIFPPIYPNTNTTSSAIPIGYKDSSGNEMSEGLLASQNADAPNSADLSSPPSSVSGSFFSLFTSPSKQQQSAAPLSNPVSNNNSGYNNNSSSSRINSPVPGGTVLGRNKMTAGQQKHLLDQFNSAANPQFDLESIAAMTFKEKQMWFLDRMGDLQVPWADGFVKIEVRRSNILVDSYHAVMSLKDSTDLHKWVRIQFANEPGVDAGGLEREWFGLLIEAIFSPQSGLFTYSGSDSSEGGGSYHINPTSEVNNKQHLSYFRFVGRVLGKAIMEQQSIKANLSLPLRKQIISIPITFSDLEFVDDELYRNLIWLKNNSNVANLMLDFSISYANTVPTNKTIKGNSSNSSSSGSNSSSNSGGVIVTNSNTHVVYELIPQGSDILVTDENKEEYLQLRLRHRMLDSIKSQLEYLLIGLYEVIPLDLLSVFDYQELDLLLCGVPEIDLQDWVRHTEYLGEYKTLGARHPVIRWFWKAVEAMSAEERIRLLQFTTGCARLPAQGFKALQSNDGKYRKFNIQSIMKHDSVYPRAHTCFNKLDLPVYDNEKELEAYLSVVINMEATGFSME